MRFDTTSSHGSAVIMRRWYVLLFLVGAGMAFWYGSVTDVLTYPFGPDSSRSIERARILIATGHLTADRLFPPGYPLLIWASSALGLEPARAALLIVRAGYALLPALLAWALSCVTGARSAVTIAALVALSPGLWYVGSKAGSDLPFLLLIIGGFALLLRCTESVNSTPALLAGVLLGAAYVVRNAGVAAFVAVGTTLGAATLCHWFSRRRVLRIAVAFTVGATLVVLPLLLWNYIEFGKLQPYAMPRSNVGLLTNIRVYIEQAVLDLVASRQVAKYVAWDYWLLIGAGIGFALLLIAGIRSRWSVLGDREKFALGLLVSYAAAGASMATLARTLYQWGEYINLRHVVQYSWCIYPAAALLINLPTQGVPRRLALMAVSMTIGALIATRMIWLLSEYRENKSMHQALVSTNNPASAVKRLHDKRLIWTGALKRWVADDRRLITEIDGIPADAIVMSNFADVLRIKTGRPVRTLEFDSPEQLVDQLAAARPSVDLAAPIDALIFPTNDLLKSGRWDAVVGYRTPGYKIVAAKPGVIWLRTDTLPIRQMGSSPRSPPSFGNY